MSNYPKNRIYAVMTTTVAKTFIGELVSVARKTLDGHSLVWDFANDDLILDRLRDSADVVLYDHSEILKVMQNAEWSAPEEW